MLHFNSPLNLSFFPETPMAILSVSTVGNRFFPLFVRLLPRNHYLSPLIILRSAIYSYIEVFSSLTLLIFVFRQNYVYICLRLSFYFFFLFGPMVRIFMAYTSTTETYFIPKETILLYMLSSTQTAYKFSFFIFYPLLLSYSLYS